MSKMFTKGGKMAEKYIKGSGEGRGGWRGGGRKPGVKIGKIKEETVVFYKRVTPKEKTQLEKILENLRLIFNSLIEYRNKDNDYNDLIKIIKKYYKKDENCLISQESVINLFNSFKQGIFDKTNEITLTGYLVVKNDINNGIILSLDYNRIFIINNNNFEIYFIQKKSPH